LGARLEYGTKELLVPLSILELAPYFVVAWYSPRVS
jgi:hypothetical protein